MPLLPISHHKQRQQADCLAACAAMLLDYFHISIKYDKIIKRLRIGRAGAPFRNLQYLTRFGVSVHIQQGNINTLRSYLKQGFPLIVFVTTRELSYWNEATNHAVVVAGIDASFIYLNDPHFTNAPQVVSIAEFDLAWFEMEEYYALIKPKR